MTTTVSSSTVSQSLLDSVNTRSSTTTSSEDTQDRFMTLLIEQMKNQDPLNPMDNAQVTSQMAQLSTVTGIETLNDTMTSLMSSFQTSESYQAANMIGNSVLVSGDDVTTSGEGGYLGVELDTSVDKVNITISDSSGTVIRNIELSEQDAGIVAVKWDGLNNDGTTADSGDYTFTATSTVDSTTSTAKSLTLATVLSVSSNSSSVKLNLSNNDSVSISDVKEIY